MQNQITEGPILRPLLFYFFPILLGTFFQQFYNTVDAIIVGNFVGTAALGAVGSATSVIINFLVNLFVGLSSGATVVIARYYGARQGEELRKAVHTAAAIALTAGVLTRRWAWFGGPGPAPDGDAERRDGVRASLP